MARTEPNHIDGLLLVDKTPDWTSHDVVNLVRRRFNLDKTGHCGTLDPLATGLLVLLLGKATKFQDQLMGQDKVYEAVLRLGVETSTEDRSGEVIATRDWAGVTEEAIRSTAATARLSVALVNAVRVRCWSTARCVVSASRQSTR